MKQIIQHPSMYKGVDSTSPPHLIDPQKWRVGSGIRFFNGLSQSERKVIKGDLRTSSEDTLLQMSGLQQPDGRILLVGLTESQIFQFKANAGTGIGQPLKWNGNQFRFTSDNIYRRWGTSIYNKNVYFTNELNPIRYSDGTQVKSLGRYVPSARYVENYYDHLIVGYCRMGGHTYPSRVMWSDLYNFASWSPSSTNETDFFDLEEYSLADIPLRGITGVKKLNKLCIIYTPTAIVAVNYVGLPKIMLHDAVATELGNGLPYSLVAFRDGHFFYNILDNNFYQYTAEGITPIGDSIQGFWTDNIDLTDLDSVNKVWGYGDRLNNEIVWCFKSRTTTNGETDKAIVYNYRTKEWSHRNIENIHSFFWGGLRAKTIDQISTVWSGITTEARAMSETGEMFYRMYGTSATRFLTDSTATDPISDCLFTDGPVLETGDYTYGDIAGLKEVDSMVIHASWDDGVGLKVEYAVRSNLEDAVVWKEAGIWTPQTTEGRLSLPRAKGRIFRYRFTMLGNDYITNVVSNTVAQESFTIRAELEIPTVIVPPDPGPDPIPPPTHIPFRKFNGPVYAILPGPNGSAFVSGRFTKYGLTATEDDAKGICLINLDGTINAGFAVGVNASGFDITENYWAPTQLQGSYDSNNAFDGILCGMSYSFLNERTLWDAGAVADRFNRLRWGGADVAPIIKLKLDGTRDTVTFNAEFLIGVATTPRFSSFHARPGFGIYYTYVSNASFIDKNGASVGALIDAVTLSKASFLGVKQISYHTNATFIEPRVVLMDLPTSAANFVACSGLWGDNSSGGTHWRVEGGVGENPYLGPDNAKFNLMVFDASLNPNLGWMYATYPTGVATNPSIYGDGGLNGGDTVDNQITKIITGYSASSIFAGWDPSLVNTNGSYGNSPISGQQGLFYLNTAQSQDTAQNDILDHKVLETGLHSYGIELTKRLTIKNATIELDAYQTAVNMTVRLVYPDGSFATPLPNPGGGYLDTHRIVLDLSIYVLTDATLTLVVDGTTWFHAKAFHPSLLVTTPSSLALWNTFGDALHTDPTKQGFTVAALAAGDDGDSTVRPLWSHYNSHPTTNPLEAWHGVYVSGPISKFRSVVIQTRNHQLTKIRIAEEGNANNGILDTAFALRLFGPATLTLPKNVGVAVSGANPLVTHVPKVMVAVLSPDELSLYVGGRFTSVDGDTTTYCHIIALNAKTGASYA